jgi:hypothetical protein
MALGDVWKLQSFGRFLSQVNMNVFAVQMRSAGEPNAADFLALANDFKEANRLLQSPRFSYTGWRAVQVRADTITYPPGTCKRVGGLFYEGVQTGTLTGGGSSPDDLPPQCAFVVTLRSNEIGRSRRGRLYIGGHTEDYQGGGTWTGTFMTNMTNSWNTFMAKYNFPTGTSPTFALTIWSERIATGCVQLPGGGHSNVNPSNPDDAAIGVYSHTLRSTVHTQRRRVVGVGL